MLFRLSYLNLGSMGAGMKLECESSDLTLSHSCPSQSLKLKSPLFPLRINNNYLLSKLQTFMFVVFF